MPDKDRCVDCGSRHIMKIFDKPMTEYPVCPKCLAERVAVARSNERELWR